jgi:glycosyltransferase involved in cell wall biosynthesis
MKGPGRIRKIVLSTSFFPVSTESNVPAFVKEQVEALISEYPDLQITVLSPHSRMSSANKVGDVVEMPGYRVVRYHYLFPRRFQRFGDEGILPTIRNNPFFFFVLPLFFGVQFLVLLKICRQFRPDLIYSHWFTPQGVTGQFVSMMTGIPHVFTSHSTDIQVWNKIPLVGPALVRYLVPKSRAISMVSAQTGRKLKAFFREEEWQELKNKVHIIPMGLKSSTFQPVDITTKSALKKQVGLSDKTVVLFVGRLVEKKGIAYLLSAFAELKKSQNNICLVIAGDGPLKSKLQESARQLGVADNVHFLGFISGEEKLHYFKVADLLVVPSIVASDGDCEGLPVVLLEGLASGLVCLATRESGAEMCIRDGENGFLIRAEEGEEITRKLCELLELPKNRLISIQREARKTSKKFDWKRIARAHYELFVQK